MISQQDGIDRRDNRELTSVGDRVRVGEVLAENLGEGDEPVLSFAVGSVHGSLGFGSKSGPGKTQVIIVLTKSS